jgi:hypothetical protein
LFLERLLCTVKDLNIHLDKNCKLNETSSFLFFLYICMIWALSVWFIIIWNEYAISRIWRRLPSQSHRNLFFYRSFLIFFSYKHQKMWLIPSNVSLSVNVMSRLSWGWGWEIRSFHSVNFKYCNTIILIISVQFIIHIIKKLYVIISWEWV